MRIHPRFTDSLFILPIVCIIALSFRAFAPQLSPGLNSDNAIHVLMAYDLKLPDDLYYWGQNRLGSLIPVLGHFALKVVPLSPVQVVGIVNYVVITIAYCCFASFLSRPFSKILLATVFFLPLRLYQEIFSIGQPYPAQFAFLGLASVGVRWLLQHWTIATVWRRQIMLMLTLGSMVASLWISDFSIVYLVVLMGGVAYRLLRTSGGNGQLIKRSWSLLDGITISATMAVGLGFLRLAKHSAARSSSYTQFNSPSELADLLGRMARSVIRNLRFEGQDLWISLAAYFGLAVASCLIYLIWRYRHTLLAQPSALWLGIWGLSAGLSMGILLLSNWVYNPKANVIPQRYFVVVYALCWLTALLAAELIPTRPRTILTIGLVGFAIASSLSLPPRVFSLNPPLSTTERLAALEPLAPAGFIGNYWRSYILCSANPSLFDCTSHDRRGEVGCPEGNGNPYLLKTKIVSMVRCERCVERVLNSPTIYFVKQRWFEQFPQRIEQFGYCFVKSGESLKVDEYDIAPYRKLDAHEPSE